MRHFPQMRNRKQALAPSPARRAHTESGKAHECAARLDESGDSAYYLGRWDEAQRLFERAWGELADTVHASSASDRTLALGSTIARNLAVLKAQRDFTAGIDPWTRRASRLAERVRNDHERAGLLVDLAVWESMRLRTVGRWAEAHTKLDALDDVVRRAIGSDTGRDSRLLLYARIRMCPERASIHRAVGEWAIAKNWLRQLFAAIALARQPAMAPHWSPVFIPMETMFGYHYLGVVAIERVLFEPRVDDDVRANALMAESDLKTALELARRPRGLPAANRIYEARTLKALALTQWRSELFADAVDTAMKARAVAEGLGDWRTTCLTDVTLAVGRAGMGKGGAMELLEGAYQRAREQGYWKGKLLAAYFGVRTARGARDEWAEKRWRGRLTQLSGPLAVRARESLRLSEDTIDRAHFRRLVQEWHRDTEFESSGDAMVMHPAYQRIIGGGQRFLPFIIEAVAEGETHWSWALTAITGDRPVPADARGDRAVVRRAWLEWARRSGISHAFETDG